METTESKEQMGAVSARLRAKTTDVEEFEEDSRPITAIPTKRNLQVVVLVGPPGCGKGTQAPKIAKRFRLKHLSTGDLLRAEVKSGSTLGIELHAIMQRGELVSDSIIVELVRKVIVAELANGGGILLDGFPRTLPQARLVNPQSSTKPELSSAHRDG